MNLPRRILWGLLGVGALVWGAGKAATLYVDYLWFDSLGYGAVFTAELWTRLGLGSAVFVLTLGWLGGNAGLAARLSPGRYLQFRGLPWVIPSQRLKRMLTVLGAVAAAGVALGFALEAADLWYVLLQCLNRVSFHWTDPVLGYDAGFYVFVLPVLRAGQHYALAMAVLGLAAGGAAYFVGGALGWPYARMTRTSLVHLSGLVALLLVALGLGFWLDRFDLLLSSRGTVYGAGYVDATVRTFTYAVMAAACLVGAVLAGVAGWREQRRLALGALGALGALYAVAVWSYPSFVQWFDVAPNELARELPYLEHNIRATRFAFGLADVEVRPYPAGEAVLTAEDVRKSRGTLENVRLWDWRVLRDTYREIQGLRTYYRFNDVDVDRYLVDGRLRQVSLSVRELDPGLLEKTTQTWVNLHLLYTHGYGLCLSPVNAVTESSLPELWIRDIPPLATASIPAPEPAVYFGELTEHTLYVRTRQEEFDYPLKEENVYTRYRGGGGVAIDSWLRRLLFAYYFRDWNVLLTDSFTPETVVLWRRQVRDRAARLAPFLRFDRDPYAVIHDGRLVWIIDAYTHATRFPYSAPPGGREGGTNYLRNAVKAVVDAYDGTITFYVADREDPLVLVARAIFPDLFRDIGEMPDGLRAHLRYPIDLFEVQAEQYLAYHMTDARVFYNREDLWQRPFELYAGKPQPVASYYIIMTLPGETAPEYLLMLPLTPARKDNMAAWLAGRCDGKNYGKLLVYTFPKDRLVLGPRQVEANIDKNDAISQQITLWDQIGSRVIRGNLLVIPIGNTILYVEPLYLDSEQTRFPELKRVIVATRDRIAMRPTLEEALAAVVGGGPAVEPTPGLEAPKPPALPPELRDPTGRALKLFERAQQQMRDGDWAGYGRTMEDLGKVLREMGVEPPK